MRGIASIRKNQQRLGLLLLLGKKDKLSMIIITKDFFMFLLPVQESSRVQT